MPRQDPALGLDAIIGALLQAEDRYGRHRHPGEPWQAFLRRTLPRDTREKLRRLDDSKKGSGRKSL